MAEETGPSKSLNFHRFMRHARDCHKNLLEFLFANDLLNEVGASELIANERKTLIECTDRVAERLRALPYVESASEFGMDAQPTAATRQPKPPAAAKG
ncbi:MAG: hypothetical protein ACAH80_08740 [Alphaproteobacteria bacterium]